MSPRIRLAAILLAVAGCGTAAHATTFGLENSLGATPTFSVSSGGNTATFSSLGGPYQVQNTSGLLSFNTALVDNNFFGTDPLTVSFSSAITGTLIVPFAILDAFGSGDTLQIVTNTGQSMTFGTRPDSLPLAEPEGIVQLMLTGSTQSFTLTTNGNPLAIGDISNTAAAVTPEPGSILLLATGMVGLAALALQRRRAGLAAR